MWYALMPRACPSIETAPPTRTPTLTGSSPVRIGFASIDDRAGLLATARISRWVCRWSFRALATLAPHHLQLAWLHQHSDPSGPFVRSDAQVANAVTQIISIPSAPGWRQLTTSPAAEPTHLGLQPCGAHLQLGEHAPQ